MKKLALVVAGLLAANTVANVALSKGATTGSIKGSALEFGRTILTLVLTPAPITYKKMVGEEI